MQLFVLVSLFAVYPTMLWILWTLIRDSYTLPLITLVGIWGYFIDDVPYNGKGRAISCFRKWSAWKWIRDYFPAKIIQTVPLTSSKAYVFAVHPHGIFCSGAWVNFVSDSTDFSKDNENLDVAIATVSFNFFLPLWRDFMLAIGFIDASPKSLQAALARGRSVVIAVGGAAESLDSHPGIYDLTLEKRRGFIKLAMTMGTPIVPVFTFGETNIYTQVSNPRGSLLRKFQEFYLSFFRFALPILTTKWWLIPRRRCITTVIGKPIPIPIISDPSEELIKKYHKIYTEELIKLFELHKAQCGDAMAVLNIVQ